MFYACLRTGDDKSAHLFLERLTQRFGASDDRIMGLRGLYQEAVADDLKDIREILLEYNQILRDNPMNIPVHKRRIALIRSLKQYPEAISALVDFLDSFPTDTEAWCELSDLYHSQGMSSQAIFCLEEALLATPLAWNLHARLGEMEYIAGSSANDGTEASQRSLLHAMQRFSRSVELCDNYIRGYYGLKLTTDKLLQNSAFAKNTSAEGPSKDTVTKLNELATRKLKHTVQTWSRQGLANLNEAEVIAVQELLDRSPR